MELGHAPCDPADGPARLATDASTQATLRELAVSLGPGRPASVSNLTRRIDSGLAEAPKLGNETGKDRIPAPPRNKKQGLTPAVTTRVSALCG